METNDIIVLYQILKDGFDNNDWNTIETGIEFICEFLDDEICE